jgi:hypothetical protein
MYAETVYFEGAHFAHIVTFEEHKRMLRIQSERRQRLETITATRSQAISAAYLAAPPAGSPSRPSL